jgi:hypothetical protein
MSTAVRSTTVCSPGIGSSSVLDARRRRRTRGRSISVIETRPGSGAILPTASSRGSRPAASEAVDGRVRSRACTIAILGPGHMHAGPPPARADGQDWGRQGSPTRCTCWGVRLAVALSRSRPRRSLRCWHGLPPTLPLTRQGPPPEATGKPSGRQRRCGSGRAQPHRAQQGQRGEHAARGPPARAQPGTDRTGPIRVCGRRRPSSRRCVARRAAARRAARPAPGPRPAPPAPGR